MKAKAAVVLATLVLLFAATVFAKPIRFVNEGLKNITIVNLDVAEKSATGTMVVHDRMEEPGRATAFSGKVIPAPLGKKGVYLEIHFEGTPPYDTHGFAHLIWHLTIVEHRAHLFIPLHERNYEGKTPRWVVDEMELVPED
jgi:hypothetical protein